LQIEIL